MKAPTRKTFEGLLFAAFNVAPEPHVEPGSKRGRVINSTALETTRLLYDLMDRSPAHRDGVLIVVRLLAETTCAKAPEEYAKEEARAGLNALRHEEDGATIKLPRGK